MENGDLRQSGSLTGKMTTAYLICLACPFLLFTGLNGYVTITGQKWCLFIALTLAYAVLCAVCAVYERGAASPLSLWKKLSLPQKLALGYWLMCAVSTLASVDIVTAFFGDSRREGFVTVTAYCAVFLLVSAFAKPGEALLWVFGAAVTASGVLSCVQLAGRNPLWLYPRGMNYYDAYRLYSGEFIGTAGNADIVSAVNCLAVPVCWLSVLKLEKKRRFLLLIPLALCLLVQMKTFVLGGILGIAAGVLITLPLLFETKKARKTAGILVAVLLAVCLLAVFFFGGRLGGFPGELSALMHGKAEDSFGTGRIFIWRNALKLVPERPLFGGGPDTLSLRIGVQFERHDDAIGTVTSVIDAAHSEYLNILVNEGALALAFYLALLVCAAVKWLKAPKENETALICGGAVCAYCVQAFVGIRSPISAPLFWALLALIFTDTED